MTWTLIALSVKERFEKCFCRSSRLCIGSIFVAFRFLRLGTIRSKQFWCCNFGTPFINAFSLIFFLQTGRLCVDVCRLANTLARHSKGIGMVLFENTPTRNRSCKNFKLVSEQPAGSSAGILRSCLRYKSKCSGEGFLHEAWANTVSCLYKQSWSH